VATFQVPWSLRCASATEEVVMRLSAFALPARKDFLTSDFHVSEPLRGPGAPPGPGVLDLVSLALRNDEGSCMDKVALLPCLY